MWTYQSFYINLFLQVDVEVLVEGEEVYIN